MNATDPLGLYCSVDDSDTIGECGDDWFDDFAIFCCTGGGGGVDHRGGGGGGGGQPPPQQPINFPNETLGLPNGFPTNPWGVWGAIIPNGNCGDITCAPIGSGFLGTGLPSIEIFNLNPGLINYIALFVEKLANQLGCSSKNMLVTGYDNSFQSTGKNPGDRGYGITADGSIAEYGTIAAPSTYPFNTQMYVPGYGLGIVSDRGGAIQGSHVDVWFPTTQQATNWGAQHLSVTVCP